VGFGESSGEPIRWNDTGPQRQDDREFRLAEVPEGRLLSLRPVGGEWVDRLKLSVMPRSLPDFAEMCDYHQTSPESPFPREAFISLPQPDGRVTLTSQRLIITRQGEKTETALPDRAAFFENLERHFGVVLSPELRQGLERKVWPGEV
jgi:N-hydroxyarylamine O-acetyltransferase